MPDPGMMRVAGCWYGSTYASNEAGGNRHGFLRIFRVAYHPGNTLFRRREVPSSHDFVARNRADVSAAGAGGGRPEAKAQHKRSEGLRKLGTLAFCKIQDGERRFLRTYINGE